MERLEVSPAIVFWFQQVEGSEYVVDGRVTFQIFRRQRVPWPGLSRPLIQFLYARHELSVLSFQHFGIARGEIPPPKPMERPVPL
jgi:hypothetical protein